MNIDIKNGLAEIDYKVNRKSFNKVITLQSLMEAMTCDKGLSTPLLPFGCRKYIKQDNKHILYLEIPPATRRVVYKTSGSGKMIFEGIIPMPWGLLKMTINEGQSGALNFTDGFIWALSRPLISEDDLLYHYPVPNIHSDDRICWGSSFSNNGSSRISNIAEAGKAIDIFFSSDFNTDIHPRINIYPRFEDLCRKIKDTNKFPIDVLSGMGTVKSIMK